MCIRDRVLSQVEFDTFAAEHLVLVEVDFPHGKQQTEELKKANEELSQKYNIEGLPTIIVLSSDGKELKKTAGYGGQSAKDFVAELEKLKKQG